MPDEFGIISLPIINAFISAGAFKTQSAMCKIITDELLQVYVWNNAENIWFRGLQAPFSKTHLVLWAAWSLCCTFLTAPIAGTDSTHRGRKRACGNPHLYLQIREEELHAINKNDCKPQNKQAFEAEVSIWSNPQSHLCPKVSLFWCHQQQLEESQERKEM